MKFMGICWLLPVMVSTLDDLRFSDPLPEACQRILGSELHISIFCNILVKKMKQTRKIMFRVSGTRRKHAQEQDMIIITTGHAAEVRPTPLELGARAFLR